MKNSADRGWCHPLSTSPPHPSRSAEFCGCVMIACRARNEIRPCLPRGTYSRTSLIRTMKGQSKVSVLERCPYERGHYDDVTFMTFKCSVAKTGLTPVFKLHLNLIHSTKTLSFSSILHCTSQLQSETVQSLTNHCFKTKRATAQCCKSKRLSRHQPDGIHLVKIRLIGIPDSPDHRSVRNKEVKFI